MSGPFIDWNGDVISSALSAAGYSHAGDVQDGSFQLDAGQIIATYPIDDTQNNPGFKGINTLYDVRVSHPDGTTETIRRCIALQPLFGGALNNFFEVLPPDVGPDASSGKKSSNSKRAPFVLVGYVSGQKYAGIILGALPHANPVAVARRPGKANGTYMEGEFQGLNFKVKNDGSLKITFNGPKDDSGSITGTNGPTVIETDASGSVFITTNASQKVEVNRSTKTINVLNGTTSVKLEQDGSKITMESDEFMAKARKKATIEVDGKVEVKSTGEAVISSDSGIKLAKGGAASEPFVLGNVFIKLMSQFLQAVSTHTHNIIAPVPSTPTTPPLNAADFVSLKSSPVEDKQVISKHIKGSK